MKYTFDFLEGECWWGGSSSKCTENPFTKDSFIEEDFFKLCRNQTMPLYLSNKGRVIWSENPFKVKIEKGKFDFEGKDITIEKAGENLKDAYLYAMKKYFPFDGKKLPEEFFKTAQYNTWMEYTYNPTQEKVLEYAKSIIDNGFEPGILIIDEGWHGRYGIWEFDFHKFPDPKKMVSELHKMGFIVMLWVVPCVCADGQDFSLDVFEELHYEGEKPKYFIRNTNGEVALFKWWNGYSALLDMTKEWDRKYLDDKLQYLMKEYNIDGFKFDGGSVDMYERGNNKTGELSKDYDPALLNLAWNEFGRKYKYHEYKDSYKCGGKNTIERIEDRGHRWDFDGINTLIPCSILQGLLGSPFICPDMIGGGEWGFTIMPNFKLDEELFVRMAEVSALCPMMQFSWAPWRLLSKENLEIVKNMAKLHYELSPYIIDLVKKSEVSGEPVVRSLFYNDPNEGYEFIKDEFMVGEDILVAPIVTKNTYKRKVVFPKGNFKDSNNNIYEGRKEYVLDAPLDKLLWFKRI